MRTTWRVRAVSRWFVLVVVSACGRSVVEPAPALPLPPPPPPTVAAPVAPVVVPVGAPAAPDVAAQPFEPGRYAVVVHRRVHGTHHHNVYDEDSQASLAVTFAGDGGVTGCRTFKNRSSHYTDRGTTHSAANDQQGYRGRWSIVEGGVDLRLEPDDGACPPVRRYSNLAPKPWQLRCSSATPEGHTRLAVPVLACRLQNRPELTFSEEFGLELSGLFAEPTVLLGGGNGVEITWKAGQLVPPEDTPVVKIEVAGKRIEVPAP